MGHGFKGLEGSSPRFAAITKTATRARMTYPQKITFGEMREMGARDVLIYRRDYRCGHRTEANADGWPDDVRLSDIEPRYLSTLRTTRR